MYISLFWAGVLATLAAEFVVILVAAVAMSLKKKK